jgi:hypothetical protein
VPFVRFSRDKRGYEHTYLVQPVNKRGKSSRPRVLYWFRSPPGVKVGRAPFDEAAQRALEAQNPGVVFDWPTIISTPMPPVDPEPWRERRRVERAERAARKETTSDAANEPGDESREPLSDASAAASNENQSIGEGQPIDHAEPVAQVTSGEPSRASMLSGPSEPGGPIAPSGQGSQAVPGRRRRRRGGRRRHRPDAVPGADRPQGPPRPADNRGSADGEG